MLTVVHDPQVANDETAGHRSLLDEIVRDGARQMLAAALKAEVAAYVEQFADQLDENGRRLVVRSGYHHTRERPRSTPWHTQRTHTDHTDRHPRRNARLQPADTRGPRPSISFDLRQIRGHKA